MNPPSLPPSKIGNEAVFSPPVSIGASPPRRGRVIDEVWSEPSFDPQWGWYVYTSQLIEWEDTEHGRSIRITYYYHPLGSDRWIFGGQYSIEDTPEIINEHLRRTLAKDW